MGRIHIWMRPIFYIDVLRMRTSFLLLRIDTKLSQARNGRASTLYSQAEITTFGTSIEGHMLITIGLGHFSFRYCSGCQPVGSILTHLYLDRREVILFFPPATIIRLIETCEAQSGDFLNSRHVYDDGLCLAIGAIIAQLRAIGEIAIKELFGLNRGVRAVASGPSGIVGNQFSYHFVRRSNVLDQLFLGRNNDIANATFLTSLAITANFGNPDGQQVAGGRERRKGRFLQRELNSVLRFKAVFLYLNGQSRCLNGFFGHSHIVGAMGFVVNIYQRIVDNGFHRGVRSGRPLDSHGKHGADTAEMAYRSVDYGSLEGIVRIGLKVDQITRTAINHNIAVLYSAVASCEKQARQCEEGISKKIGRASCRERV